MVTAELVKPIQVETESRPTSRVILPFRATRSNRDGLCLTCDALLRDGQKSPHEIRIGDPEAEVTAMYNPVGKAVWKLMTMFWDLEATIDPITKERDELRDNHKAEIDKLNSQLKAEKARVAELVARMDRMERKK